MRRRTGWAALASLVVLLALVAAVVWAALARGAGDVEADPAAVEPAARPNGRREAAERRTRALRRELRVRTVTKLRTSHMKPVQTIDACYHPIGITYDQPTRRVCCTGKIRVYDDR